MEVVKSVYVASKHPDIMEFYDKRTVTTIHYDTLGNKLYEMVKIDKKGTYGRLCHEIRYEFVKYRPDGTREWSLVSKCDCHREIYKTYNKKGKVLTRTRKKIVRLT